MTDSKSFSIWPYSAGEPKRDAQLGALLRDVVGEPPMSEVNWPHLAERIGAAVSAHQSAPWWSYAERWQRRAIPLALAAGLVGALAFLGTAVSTRADASSPDLVSAVVTGTSPADAASSFARSVTGTMDYTSAVPE
jgi:hypothetical protein